MKKLPENIKFKDSDSGEISEHNMSGAINAIVKEKKVAEYEDTETGVSKEPKEIVKDFFMMHFNATDENPAELPDGMDDYSDLWDTVAEYAKDHMEAVAEEKKLSEAEREAKKQQREAQKAAKEKEDKKFSDNQSKFTESLIKRAKSTEDVSAKLIQTVTKAVKLPSNVTFAANGMGLVVGEKVTTEQFGEATASIFSALEGQDALKGALQFVAGDLVNASVKARIFRTKNEAQAQIVFVLKEKLSKSYDAGSLNQYANMADRIPVESRKVGVSPALYFQISKAAPPKLADAKPEDKKAMEENFNTLREELIEKANNGDFRTGKEINAEIDKFREANGIIKKDASQDRNNLIKYLKQFFFAYWAKENLVGIHDDKEDIAVFEEDEGAYIDIPVGTLTDYLEDASSNLQNMLIPDADKAIAGETEEKGKKVSYFPKNFFITEEEAAERAKAKAEAKIKAKEKAAADKAAAEKKAADPKKAPVKTPVKTPAKSSAEEELEDEEDAA